MHKKIIFIMLLVILSTGCTRIEKEDNNYNDIIIECLSKKIITNEVARGYKFYIPKGVKLIKNYDYNQKFLIDNDDIYLYVDIVSYYYKKELTYEEEINSYYYKKISYNGKKGYIKITEEDNKYLVKIVYNYSKIEAYTTKDKLNKVVTLGTIILNNIDYNDKIIEKTIDESVGTFREVTYELDKPEDASNKFREYLEEYVQKEKEEEKVIQLPDE
ncbi:MAG: hypothetical protein IJI49_05285 [Bacilli bacterium]|nr:hypothetical protein [Bacilli bacterium]